MQGQNDANSKEKVLYLKDLQEKYEADPILHEHMMKIQEISNKWTDKMIEFHRKDGQKFIDRRREVLQNRLEMAERKC